MIKIENYEMGGFESAIRGMRNPMNSWDKSDSYFLDDDGDAYNIRGETFPWPDEMYVDNVVIGENDFNLMEKLSSLGPVHAKFRRMIVVYADITAPLYWWKEFDTYKVGTVTNSCSTMHKIAAKEFEPRDFSLEHIRTYTKVKDDDLETIIIDPGYKAIKELIKCLNISRERYLESKDKEDWWQMIQLLPSSYNQRRTVMMNFEVLSNIYANRKNHKLDEWRDFCAWIENLPLGEGIIFASKEEEKE